MTLAIPQHRDPVARGALLTCAFVLVWLAISSAMPAASAKEEPQVVIVVATPTLPASAASAAPMAAAATAAPQTHLPPRPTEAPAAAVEAPPASVLVDATEPPALEQSHVGERGSDKAPPSEDKAPPVVRH